MVAEDTTLCATLILRVSDDKALFELLVDPINALDPSYPLYPFQQ